MKARSVGLQRYVAPDTCRWQMGRQYLLGRGQRGLPALCLPGPPCQRPVPLLQMGLQHMREGKQSRHAGTLNAVQYGSTVSKDALGQVPGGEAHANDSITQ